MGLRSGRDYIERLSENPPEVWVRGRRAAQDITQDPIFRRPVRSIAKLYDLQLDPTLRETMTYQPADADGPAGTSFMIPRTEADLLKRREAMRIWAEATFGLVGRSPDFLNTVLMSWAENPAFFARKGHRFADNVLAYYRYCRENDLFLTHAIVNPQNDRSKASHEQENAFTHLGVVKETSDGLIVRGAKMLATHGPTADELLVYPQPGLRPGEEKHVIAFAIPSATKGLRYICREPFDDGTTSEWDHPLSSRYEEPDAVCVFDDVLIPWERVFLYGDIAMGNALFSEASMTSYMTHQAAVRGLAKTQLLTGIAIATSRAAKTDVYLHVQEQLGELLTYVEMIRSGILASEVQAEPTGRGAIRPAFAPIRALRYLQPRWYERMVQVTQVLGAGGLLLNPTAADFDSPIRGDLDLYYRGAGVDAERRTRIAKLAWDATGTQFGQRMLQYERYYGGDPMRNGATYYLAYNTDPLMTFVERAIEGK